MNGPAPLSAVASFAAAVRESEVEPPNEHGHWNVVLLGAGRVRGRAVLDRFVATPGIVVYAADQDRHRLESARGRLGDGPHLAGLVGLHDDLALRRVLAAADALVDLTPGASCRVVLDACVLERVAYLDATGNRDVAEELALRSRVVQLRDMVAVTGLDAAHAPHVLAATIRAMQRRRADGGPLEPGVHAARGLVV